MSVKSILSRQLRRFRDDTRGTVAIEAVIALPVLFWVFLASFVFFDAYRQHSINVKAAYMVGDMLSRETNAVDTEYLDGMKSLFDYLTKASTQSRIRVTVLQWDEEDEAYTRDWSEVRGGGIAELTNADLQSLSSKLPVMSDNERLILVETWAHYTPPFKVGLAERDMYNFVFTSPRFAPLLRWQS
ncbi:hypothetical protein SAMN06265173_10388 [Thalassovita litoralis]|jgi:hypothetical protein|uniref:Flp pilus assembly protein TadG n=1 Tax=Thalassovita litoralis TaxID=1010611 RepID=A0A521BJI4_9RHOB|nr:hypothetical protein [Thalassovita litoralis]SMO47327.1 hypothetical protein SAMN06265173_10388 [Thalassovita litoralis]